MQSKIIVTGDNSKTLLIPELNETYHSTKGAITEAKHVFIKEGLYQLDATELSIFEMGFGTGLNAIITFNEALQKNLTIDYQTIESNPLSSKDVSSLDYLSELNLGELEDAYLKMHQSINGKKLRLQKQFSFTNFHSKIEDQLLPDQSFDLIYYDAFGPKVQAELWEIPVLKKMYNSLKTNGILVTYCAQGQFKRNLKKIGFKVESIPGPPGKREMTRAIK